MASTHKQIMLLVSATLGELFTSQSNPTLVHWKFGRHSWETEDRVPPVVGWVPTVDSPRDSYRTQGILTTCGGAMADVIASWELGFDIYLWGNDGEDDIAETERLRDNVILAAHTAMSGWGSLVQGSTTWLSQQSGNRYQKKKGVHGTVALQGLSFVAETFNVLQDLTTIVTASVDVTGSFPVTGSTQTTGSLDYIAEPVVRVTVLSGSQ